MAADDALIRLRDNLRELIRMNTNENRAILHKHLPVRRPQDARSVKIETMELLTFLYLIDRWSNVVDLTTAVLGHLDGQPFVMPELRPDSPIASYQAELDAERPKSLPCNVVKSNSFAA